MNLWRFVRNRAGYHWQIFLTLSLGIIFATVLLASGPLIVNTVLNLSIPNKLHSSEPLDGNIRLTAYERFSREDYIEYNSYVQGLIFTNLQRYMITIKTGGNSGFVYPWIDGLLVRDHRISLGYYQSLEEKTYLLSGKWPADTVVENDEVRVVISESLSNDYQLKVGDRLPLSHSTDESEPSIFFIISGIISPNEIQEIYWFGDFNPLSVRGNESTLSSYSVFIGERIFFEITSKIFPNARSELYWNVFLDPHNISFDQINLFESHLNNLRLEMVDVTPKINIATNITNILETFSSRARIVRITLYVLIGEVLFLAIYYLIMVSTLFSEYLSAEFSNLFSRGSSFKKISLIQFLEALVICGLAFVIGILLAISINWWITINGPIAEVNDSSWKIQIPKTSMFAAGIGILICIFCLLLPIRNSLKRSVVFHFRETGRKERVPFWQRFYLDIFLLIAGLLLLGRLYALGGMSVAERGGSIDWLMLLAPFILLIGSATIINRFLPILFNALSKLFTLGRSVGTTLALFYISRNPCNVSRLVLLLTLTMALSVLATGLNATLDASEYERALYAIGSPVRIKYNQPTQGLSINDYIPVDSMSLVYRSNGNLNIRAYRIIPSFELLAIDPYTFIEVTKYRSDYASKPMGQVLGNLVVNELDYEYPSISLPGEPSALGIWIFNDSLLYEDSKLIALIALRGKIQTAKGATFTVNFQITTPDNFDVPGVFPSNGLEKQWYYYKADIPVLSKESYPLSLHSIWFNIRSSDIQYWRVSLLIDDISVEYLHNDDLIIDDFENLKHLWRVNDIQAEAIFTRQKPAHSGTGSLFLRMPPSRTNLWGVGLFQAGRLGENPIPVLASEEFMNITELAIGDYFYGNISSIRIPMVVAESIRYFPTLYDQPGQGFLVLPLDPLLIYLNLETIRPFNVNELWMNSNNIELIKTIDDQIPASIVIETIEDKQRSIKADPLTLGLRSIISISFWSSAILCFIGFSSTFYINSRSREIQFGVLRSMGMSIQQLYTMLFIEQAFLIFIGLTIGAILGLILNMIILPGLPISLSEEPLVPPFLPYTDWKSLISLYTIMIVVFIIILAASTLLLWKEKIHEVLRIGME